MLGDSITFNLGGTGGDAIVMPKINQDGYSAEYYTDTGTGTYRLQIRHSRDKVKAGTQAFDRHNVTFTRFVKPTVDSPLGSTSSATFILRNDPNEAPSTVVLLSDAMAHFFDEDGTVALKLVGWES